MTSPKFCAKTDMLASRSTVKAFSRYSLTLISGLLLVLVPAAATRATDLNRVAQPDPAPESLTVAQLSFFGIGLPKRNTVILQEEGVLEPGGAVLPDDTLYEEHLLEGRADQTVTIRLESDDFDTYLILINPMGEILEYNNDISSSNTNSELTVTLPASGFYRIVANTFEVGGQGQYQITVMEGDTSRSANR